jgi:hypothetical protein
MKTSMATASPICVRGRVLQDKINSIKAIPNSNDTTGSAGMRKLGLDQYGRTVAVVKVTVAVAVTDVTPSAGVTEAGEMLQVAAKGLLEQESDVV